MHFLTRAVWLAAALALGVSLSACGTVDYETFRAPDLSVIAPRATATLRETQLKPVTNEDLVSTDGFCTGVTVGPDPNLPMDQQQENAPMISSAIALDMTECDVVKRAGQPEKVDFGTNERGERTVVLVYNRGARPGIYRFTAGRLTSIERVAEPPAPKPARKPPPRRTST